KARTEGDALLNCHHRAGREGRVPVIPLRRTIANLSEMAGTSPAMTMRYRRRMINSDVHKNVRNEMPGLNARIVTAAPLRPVRLATFDPVVEQRAGGGIHIRAGQVL